LKNYRYVSGIFLSLVVPVAVVSVQFAEMEPRMSSETGAFENVVDGPHIFHSDDDEIPFIQSSMLTALGWLG
jgi:hypothetical protein